MNIKLLLIVPLLWMGCKDSEKKGDDNFAAGFKTFHGTDSSRIYKPGTESTDYLHYRPLDIDLWYPAEVSEKDTALVFGDLLGLLEKRANYYTASRAGDGITRQVAQFLCDNLKCSDTTALLRFRTQSLSGAKAAEGRFPLVVYLASFNGMSFENFAFFEALARKGFVVAVVSSIGRFPGDMTMKKADLLEQVSDAIATVNQVKELPGIDASRIGIVGYSWGGLAGTLLASQLPQAACLVSLDGSEFHHYGAAQQENIDFDSLRYTAPFSTMKLSLPYLRLESAPPSATEKEDSVYNFTEKLAYPVQRYGLDSASHEDFSCLSQTVRASGQCAPTRFFPSRFKPDPPFSGRSPQEQPFLSRSSRS